MKQNHQRSVTMNTTGMVLLVLTLATVSSCTDTRVASIRNTGQVKVDGIAGEWIGNKTLFHDNSIAFGAANDDSTLYIHIATADKRLQRQILFLGLTTYISVPSARDTIFGIRFPVKDMSGGFTKPGQGGESAMITDEQLEERTRSLQVIGPRKGRERFMLVAQAQQIGLDAALGMSGGMLILEIKVPLQTNENTPYALRSDGATEVGIRFETPQISAEDIRKKGAGQHGAGMGRGGGRGGMQGGGGKGKGGAMGGPRMPEPLHLNIKVLLANAR